MFHVSDGWLLSIFTLLYLFIGVTAALVDELIQNYRDTVRESISHQQQQHVPYWDVVVREVPDQGERWAMAGVFTVLWPFVLIYGIYCGVEALVKAVLAAKINEHAVSENKRLKEEIESLKDKLYELEP